MKANNTATEYTRSEGRVDMNRTWLEVAFNYCLSGIDFDLAGNGGKDCAEYIPASKRNWEILLAMFVCALAALVGWKSHQSPDRPTTVTQSSTTSSHSSFRLFLLGSLAFAFGLELCYKLVTRQLIFILNPCHILCLIQMYFLSTPSNEFSRKTNVWFRIHLSQLYLPVVAFVCPVINTLFLPGEVFTYYLEHVLLLAVPLYLVWFGGPSFTAEPFFDIGYSLMAYAIFGVFNFIFLQALALETLANLNSILCPAIADPFAGPDYRLHALWHQLAQSILIAKLYGCISLLPEIRHLLHFKRD